MSDAFRIRTLAEIVGLAGVVGSLLFVGLEIRQNSESTRAATVQAVQDSWLDWNLTMADPEAWAAVDRIRVLDDPDEGAWVDQAAVRSLVRSLTGNWANVHYQYVRGFVDEAYWQSVERNIRLNFDGSLGEDWAVLFRWGVAGNRGIYTEEFQGVLDQLADTGAGREP